MRVLWLCNVPTRAISQDLDIQASISGGWLETLSTLIASRSDCQLHYCFFSSSIDRKKHGESYGIKYYALPYADAKKIARAKKMLIEIVRDVNPDIVHIFGSEYLTSYAMVLAVTQLGLLEKTVLHIQGLVSICAKHYTLGIPSKWKYVMMPRDILRNSSISKDQRDLVRRGELEVKCIGMLKNICGRTEWDKACVTQINPTIKYFVCNESLRSTFYQHQWDVKNIKRLNVFVSQGNYPLKGLHFVLEALYIVRKRFPSVRLFVAGHDPTFTKESPLRKLRRTSYGQYLLSLLRKYKLQECVVFTGILNEDEMCKRLLESHVFISSSTIENSPNSLGEAMILGLPCVVSYVGGTTSMMINQEEGLFYQADAPYMLAHQLMKLFEDDELAVRLGQKAQKRASMTHSFHRILQDTIEMYRLISRGE